MFETVDADQTGLIDRHELAEFFRLMGVKLSDTEIDSAMQQIDTDNQGTVSFEELLFFVQGGMATEHALDGGSVPGSPGSPGKGTPISPLPIEL